MLLGPSGSLGSVLPPPISINLACGGGWWGCGARYRSGSAGVERQRAGEDPTGKIPIYKSLRSARKEPRTPTSKKAKRVSHFVSGFSALRELLDKTMSKPGRLTRELSYKV